MRRGAEGEGTGAPRTRGDTHGEDVRHGKDLLALLLLQVGSEGCGRLPRRHCDSLNCLGHREKSELVGGEKNYFVWGGALLLFFFSDFSQEYFMSVMSVQLESLP